MADNLPLIPGKGEAVCADVRPVLREVFRELDQLPPLTLEKTKPSDEERLWIENYKTQCEEIWQQEGKLKTEFAKRISKKRQRNIYRLFSPKPEKVESWRVQRGLIGRKDLMPAIEQNAGREKSLWVQNILNRSSCEFRSAEKVYDAVRVPLRPLYPDAYSLQTLSYGELRERPPPLPLSEEPPPPTPEYIICVPPKLDFVNFTLGRSHTQQVRLVNVSKFEVRLSLSPPRRRELDVELCGMRGLTVTAGSAAELKIHFRPRDVRTLRDELRVRVSSGKSLVVPIACYMEPPILQIIVPFEMSSVFPLQSGSEASHTLKTGQDVLDLGSKLLGDVHCAPILLQCSAAHASFFLLPEDAWISYTLEELTSNGSIATGPFTIYPAWFTGGGVTRGFVQCRATATGLQTAALRILSSTATARMIHVLADSLCFSPDHVTVQAQDKDYDICSEDDPDCEYYVNLGTAFPHRSLSATVQLVNHSPVPYSYYWSTRPWGVCSCWQEELATEGTSVAVEVDSERLCPGAKESRARGDVVINVAKPSASPAAGNVAARSSVPVTVSVADAGAERGIHRAVLLLILKDIPKDSFPADLRPQIVITRTITGQSGAGDGKGLSHEVCEVVVGQMEVWWEVAPVRFVLDPPILMLTHSRRVTSVPVSIRATQLYGCDELRTRWGPPPAPPAPPTPPAPRLTPARSVEARLLVLLPPLPNEYPETDVITLSTVTDECTAACRIERACATRHPGLAPARAWLGLVPPGASVAATLEVTNDTYQHICWWATPFRWAGELAPSAACAGAGRPCEGCRQRACRCALLRPARGALRHQHAAALRFKVDSAPDTDRCVATLVQVRRTAGDVCSVPGAPGHCARAALLAYRVLAPRLALCVLPCRGDKMADCRECRLDPGARAPPRGSALLRPSAALARGHHSCYTLRITNLTPIPTTVRWEPPVEGEDVLKVEFIPNDFDIGSYAVKEIQVVLEARKVCGRRLFAHRAQVTHAYKPLYLLIDAAIEGVNIILEVPLGDSEGADSFVTLRSTEKEVFPGDVHRKPMTAAECFAENDRKTAIIKDNTCHCHYKMVYIPPPTVERPPPDLEEGDDEYQPVVIISEPPPFTRVCPCDKYVKPILPDHVEPFCLQFRDVSLRTVTTKKLLLRNVGKLEARWRAVVRRWPRVRDRAAANEALVAGTDRWAGDVRAPGVAIQCVPAAGACAAGSLAAIDVDVYADCWGHYRDQLLLMVEGVEPLVIDVWVEVVGTPLKFALAGDDPEYDATMWLSESDEERTLRVKNTSRSQLTVHAYTLLEHEYPQDALPFRLYIRFFDVLPPTCPCLTSVPSADEMLGEVSTASSSIPEEMDIGIELFLAADHGLQNYDYYKVEPQSCVVPAGAWQQWRVRVRGPPAARGALLLRTLPDDNRGDSWWRGEPAPPRAACRVSPRAAQLRLSRRDVCVRLCALDLPFKEAVRVRKHFRVQNLGSSSLALRCAARAPWRLVRGARGVLCGCSCAPPAQRAPHADMLLEPRSSTAMCVEVCIHTEEVWPVVEAVDDCQPVNYPLQRTIDGEVTFHSEQGLLQSLPLLLELEYPKLFLEPAVLDFGFVADGDTRKAYFTVWHSSLSSTIDLCASWAGGEQFRLFPRRLRVSPGARQRVYLQYTARWSGGPSPAEGCVALRAAAGAGAWCRAALRARAQPARDHKCRAPPHDHTDDNVLLPPLA